MSIEKVLYRAHAKATGFGIEVAQALIDRAHIVCPYSNPTPGNIDVRLVLA